MFGRRKYPRRLRWYRRFGARLLHRKPISRDDSGYFSAFLVAKPLLGDLCAADTGGGDWRPCPMTKCRRPDHDHARIAAAAEAATEATPPQRASGSTG